MQALQGKSILVIGDAILDRYLEGEVSRISPEAPVPVVNITNTRDVLGGAANVAANLVSFGAKAGLIAKVGVDNTANELKAHIKDLGIDDFLFSDSSTPTSLKSRVLANNQQIVRLDYEEVKELAKNQQEEVLELLQSQVDAYDAIIVADYAKGFISAKIADKLKELANQGVLVSVDPHPNSSVDWKSVSVYKPNLKELELITGIQIRREELRNASTSESLLKAVTFIQKSWNIEHLLITMSEYGMFYAHIDGTLYHEATVSEEIYDVSGAGDTAISYFTLALAAGFSGIDATKVANQAAGLVIKKIGTATLTFDELNSL